MILPHTHLDQFGHVAHDLAERLDHLPVARWWWVVFRAHLLLRICLLADPAPDQPCTACCSSACCSSLGSHIHASRRISRSSSTPAVSSGLFLRMWLILLTQCTRSSFSDHIVRSSASSNGSVAGISFASMEQLTLDVFLVVEAIDSQIGLGHLPHSFPDRVELGLELRSQPLRLVWWEGAQAVL